MSIAAQLFRGLRLTLVLWLLTVVVTTLPLLGLARLVAPVAASGSLLRADGRVVGSRLIGQGFSSARYLQGRPAGAPNLAASNPELATRVAAAASRWQSTGVADPAADLLLDSGSGVDPHISLAAAPVGGANHGLAGTGGLGVVDAVASRSRAKLNLSTFTTGSIACSPRGPS